MSQGHARGGARTATLAESRLVGRETEIALLRAAVDEAAAGRTRVVALAGEPGIGKTAIAEYTAEHLTSLGGIALWGACWEGDGAPAYWPWIQIIRSYASGRRTDELYALMGTGATDIARLVPEVGGRFLSLSHEAEVDPDRARFRLFDHICRFLRAAAEKQPLLVVLDDLHWADRSSLMLLSFAARALRDASVLFLGTYRDVEVPPGHPLAQTIGDLSAERITLHGLSHDEVATLMRATTGAASPPTLTDAVFGRTAGNPLFVKEVARLLAAQGRIDQGGSAATAVIPEGVRDVLRRRLARLTQDCVDVLGTASVLGPDFGVDFLSRLSDHPPAEVLTLLDLAATARVIVDVPGAVGRYAFAHALIREVIYEEVGTARRAALHWRAAELLQAHHGDAVHAHLGEIANHFLHGVSAGDPIVAAGVAIRAARHALEMYAWDQGADLYARALDVLAMAPSHEEQRVQTMLELGDARTRAGDLAEARLVYDGAARLAEDLGRGSDLAHAALGFGSGLGGFEVRLFDERQIELLHRALEMLPEDDSAIRAWVLARLSVASSFVRSNEERGEMSREAVEIARRLGDPGALSYALSSLADALAGPDHVSERLDAAAEIIRLAAQPAVGAARCGVESCTVCLCNPEFALLGRRLRLVANLEAGDIVAVDEDIESYGRLAEHLRQPLYSWYMPLFRGMRGLMSGRFSDAERALDDARAVASRTSSENAALLIKVQDAGRALEQRRIESVEALWHEMTGGAPELVRFPSMSGLRVWTTALFGDAPAAVPLLHRWVAEGGLASVPKDGDWLPAAAYFAESALRAGDRESAAHIYEQLLPYEDLFTVEGIGARFMGAVAHYLGRLASFLGRFDDAERHLSEAIDAHARIGAVVWEARSRLELARALAAAGDPREELRGSLARTAAALFDACGLEDDAADARALAGGAQESAAPVDGNVFRREGDYWTVVFEGTLARLKDSKGLRDIAELLAAPGREVAALDLIGRDAGVGGRAEAGLGSEGDAGEVLDDRARAAYKARISDLTIEIEEAEAANDPIRADGARVELDALSEQLAGAYGLGGRARRVGHPAERARKAVTERIRDALAKLAKENPALHRHLRTSIRTGTFCVYAPERPVTWSF